MVPWGATRRALVREIPGAWPYPGPWRPRIDRWPRQIWEPNRCGMTMTPSADFGLGSGFARGCRSIGEIQGGRGDHDPGDATERAGAGPESARAVRLPPVP